MTVNRWVLLTSCLCFCSGLGAQSEPIVVGSKNFTESYVLGEVMALLLESRGIPVERRFGFGGTLVAFEALRAGEIDVYAEYTGTISQTILRDFCRARSQSRPPCDTRRPADRQRGLPHLSFRRSTIRSDP